MVFTISYPFITDIFSISCLVSSMKWSHGGKFINVETRKSRHEIHFEPIGKLSEATALHAQLFLGFSFVH